jgi:hypothetical protein
MHTSICFLTLLLPISFLTHAQPKAGSGAPRTSANLRVGMSSYLIYPGATAGVELPVKSVHLTRTRSREEPKTILKERFVFAGLGWYHHPRFHDNLYVTGGWIRRRKGPGGFFTELSPGIGYCRTFLGGTTYRVSGEGEVSRQKRAGHSYALLTVSGGLGYDFSRRKNTPVSVCYTVNLLALLPYNGSVYLRPVMQAGLIYQPAHFLSIKPIPKSVAR